MLLRQIRYFVEVVDCDSFTEAAERCFISQSAVSQQISALERELGVELIHRQNRKFSLTPAGEYFYTHGKEILWQAESLRRETVRIGHKEEAQLRIGYLRCYSGQELHKAVAEFARLYPEVSISILNGTHEELYDALRFDGVDLVLTDQRRAFSEEYVNFQLLSCDCYAEMSLRNPLSKREFVTMDELKQLTCILISSKEQQGVEQEYYENTLGFGSSYLFAESLEEGRLMVAGNRGFLPVESVGTLPPVGAALSRVPIMRGGQRLKRNYCVFWLKKKSDYYIEEFAQILRRLLRHEE